MERDFLLRLHDGLARDRETGAGCGDRLVQACVDAVGVTGAGIMLMVEQEHRGTFGTSNDVIAIVEDLQFTLGEGPCVDTFRTGRPVLEPDLGHPAAPRWQAFTEPAVAAGVAGIFGFPLLVGDVCLGALDLYTDRPGDLRPGQFTDAVGMAGVIAHTIMDLQAQMEPGTLAPELAVGAALRSVVHQASGMVAVQLDLPVADALARLRARAFADGRSVDDVARDIVERKLRLE